MLRLPFFKVSDRTIYSLSEEERLKTLIIDQVYMKPSQRKREIMGYTLDREYNDQILVVYKSDVENVVIVGIRGTASLTDIISDIQLVVQQITSLSVMDNSERFKKLHKMVLDIYMKYSNYGYTVKLTGHSLSGFEIMRLENLEPDKVTQSTAFNAGAPPITFYKIPKDVKHIGNPFDPISLPFKNDPQTRLYYKRGVTAFNPLANHSIKYFID